MLAIFCVPLVWTLKQLHPLLTGQKPDVVIRRDTSLSLFSLSFHLFLFLLSSSSPLHFPCSPALTLIASDSVSMLSHTNPPLRGVKALQHTTTNHNRHTHTHAHIYPVRYRSAIPLALMGFFTPKHQQHLMHRTTFDGVTYTQTHTDTLTHTDNYGKRLSSAGKSSKIWIEGGRRGCT